MVSLSLKHLHTLKAHGLKQKEILSSGLLLRGYLQDIQRRRQGFLDVAHPSDVTKDILKYTKKVRGLFEHVVVLGIGGSALGVTALMQALRPLSWNQISSKKRGGPQLHVLDNVDPELIADLDSILDYPKTLFVVISRSGTTPETVAQYLYYKKKMKKAVTETSLKKHFVMVTDLEKGFLREEALREGFANFPIPDNVGGRFSVLTAVGLLPAALVGIDIVKLLKGASRGADRFLTTEVADNSAYQLAHVQYLLQQQYGVTTTVMMAYSSALYSVADWYRQLLAESIGKAVNREGKTVHTGLTPIKALGVTDQHSQVQLYNEGPCDKLILFLEIKTFRSTVSIPKVSASEQEFSFLSGVSFADLMHTEQKATQEALTRYDRPTANISLDHISEESLGELFVMLEGSIAFLGEMYGIDAYNQPGVELGKILTKKMLLDSH